MREFLDFDQRSQQREQQFAQSGAANVFMRQVFVTMTLGLAITGMVAWFVANSPAMLSLLYGNGIMRMVVMFAPLALVFFLSARINRMSFSTASTTFAIYSVLMGANSNDFPSLPAWSNFKVFLITAGTFGSMATDWLDHKYRF